MLQQFALALLTQAKLSAPTNFTVTSVENKHEGKGMN